MSEGTGYKRPPKETRFKKGQSGNPRGRPKGSGTLVGDVLTELGRTVEVSENGRARRLTKQQLLARQLTTGAIKGDARLTNIIVKLLAYAITEEPSKAAAPVSADDKALLAEYLRSIADGSSEEGEP